VETVLIIVGVIAFIGFLIWIGHYLEKKRTESMRNAAMSLGLAFEEEGGHVLQELAGFKLFQEGHSKKLRNVISGSQGSATYKVFDYRYTVGHGKNSHTYFQTVVHLKSNRLKLPGFAMRPEHIFHKIGGVFGYQDIDFDSHPTFSKKYLLRGELEQEVRDTFKPHILDHFDKNHGLSIEAMGDELLYFKAGAKTKAEVLKTQIDDAIQVHDLFSR
jgi:hypothetical protein